MKSMAIAKRNFKPLLEDKKILKSSDLLATKFPKY
jgi:hypothetical protein